MKTLNSKALGNIHTLNAPYFENQFYPEAVLLRSVIYYKYCLYDQAEEAIADFNAIYPDLKKCSPSSRSSSCTETDNAAALRLRP